MTNTEDKERQAFEDWASVKWHLPANVERIGENYLYPSTQREWSSWQARANLESAELKQIREALMRVQRWIREEEPPMPRKLWNPEFVQIVDIVDKAMMCQAGNFPSMWKDDEE